MSNPNYTYIDVNALLTMNLFIGNPNHVMHTTMINLKKLLDSSMEFSREEQEQISRSIISHQFDPMLRIMRVKENALVVRKSFSYVGQGFNAFWALLVWGGFFLTFGVNFALLSIPFVFTWGGSVLRWGKWGIVGSSVSGIVITCTLYKYVFKEPLLLLKNVLFKLFKFALDNVNYLLGDVWESVKDFFRGVYDWLVSSLPAHGISVSGEECMLSLCNLSKHILRLGGMVTVQKLGVVLVTLLIAMNTTYEFVHTDGTRLAIIPKDFPELPSVSAQQYRIARQAPWNEAEEKIKMDIPKSPFQAKAEFKAEQEKKKPEETSRADNTWQALFYGWAVWGGKTVGEHVSMYVLRSTFNQIYTWAFGGRLRNVMPVAQAFTSALAGIVTTQVIDDRSYTVMAIAGSIGATLAWKAFGWVMEYGFDHIFKAARPADQAGIDQNARPADQAAVVESGNPVYESALRRAAAGHASH